MYYLRTRPAAQAIQFTVDQEALKDKGPEEIRQEEDALACSLQNKEACLMCSGWILPFKLYFNEHK